MNYHSNLNKTVMSTVFKLKAAVLMTCAFVVISVSNALGQGLTPVVDGPAVAFDAKGINWVVRGDKNNSTIGIEFTDMTTSEQQYALFNGDGTFVDDDVYYVDGSTTIFYLNRAYSYNVGNIPYNFGYDGNFKPKRVPEHTMTGVKLSGIFNNFVVDGIKYDGEFNNTAVNNLKCCKYHRQFSDIHNFNIYLVTYSNITSSAEESVHLLIYMFGFFHGFCAIKI